MATVVNPAKTYTLDDFVQMKFSDDMTYYNFSILEVVNGVEHLDHNLLEDYLPELIATCVDVTLDEDQYKAYKYAPDLLAYDLYGSVQLDFVIMMVNDTIDPKEFNRRTIKLPYASILNEFLQEIYGKEKEYIKSNRANNNILT